jgi:hypothetical protein
LAEFIFHRDKLVAAMQAFASGVNTEFCWRQKPDVRD